MNKEKKEVISKIKQKISELKKEILELNKKIATEIANDFTLNAKERLYRIWLECGQTSDNWNPHLIKGKVDDKFYNYIVDFCNAPYDYNVEIGETINYNRIFESWMDELADTSASDEEELTEKTAENIIKHVLDADLIMGCVYE